MTVVCIGGAHWWMRDEEANKIREALQNKVMAPAYMVVRAAQIRGDVQSEVDLEIMLDKVSHLWVVPT